MKELQLFDREDTSQLTTATSPHRQLSQNGVYHKTAKVPLVR